MIYCPIDSPSPHPPNPPGRWCLRGSRRAPAVSPVRVGRARSASVHEGLERPAALPACGLWPVPESKQK